MTKDNRKKTPEKKYQMTYFNGAGESYDGGLWEIKETPKMFIFRLLKEPFFDSNAPHLMRIKKEKEKSHCLRVWGDNTFTVYPFQSGVPHLFEPKTE